MLYDQLYPMNRSCHYYIRFIDSQAASTWWNPNNTVVQYQVAGLSNVHTDGKSTQTKKCKMLLNHWCPLWIPQGTSGLCELHSKYDAQLIRPLLMALNPEKLTVRAAIQVHGGNHQRWGCKIWFRQDTLNLDMPMSKNKTAFFPLLTVLNCLSP